MNRMLIGFMWLRTEKSGGSPVMNVGGSIKCEEFLDELRNY